MRCIIPNKIKFVDELNKTLPVFAGNIISVKYRVFKSLEYERCYQEFLEVTYVGGGQSVRSCNGNSFSAIFQELAKVLDSGYYAEIPYFEEIKSNPKWVEMTLSQVEEDYQNR